MIQNQVLIKAMGGFHDSDLKEIQFDLQSKRLVLKVDDIYANFGGGPDYKGLISGYLTMSQVCSFVVEMETSIVTFYDWEITQIRDGAFRSVITFSPTGKITFECEQVSLIENCQGGNGVSVPKALIENEK